MKKDTKENKKIANPQMLVGDNKVINKNSFERDKTNNNLSNNLSQLKMLNKTSENEK